jgi:hypothetical protein
MNKNLKNKSKNNLLNKKDYSDNLEDPGDPKDHGDNEDPKDHGDNEDPKDPKDPEDNEDPKDHEDNPVNIEDNLKNYLLDPLSVIIKLAIISKKQIGVKISISNNILYIQEVGIFQSIVRYYFNSSKNDLNFLYNPINIACKFFLNKQLEYPIENLFKCALNGLQKIKDTYKKYPLIIICINYYCDLITDALNKKNENLFKDEISEYYTDELIKKLNDYWTPDKIKLVLEMSNYIYINDTTVNSIKCLEVFMNEVDLNTQKIIC